MAKMFEIPDTIEIEQKRAAPWGAAQLKPAIENEDEKKRAFGIELAKVTPFQAACNVFGKSTSQALWVCSNWLNDPIVLAARDSYLKTVEVSTTLLDKDQLASKLLRMVEEKTANNAFYLLDGKDRLKALELYASIRGYTGKALDPSTNNFIHNQMVVKFVQPEPAHQTLEHQSDDNDQNLNDGISPLKLKLVG